MKEKSDQPTKDHLESYTVAPGVQETREQLYHGWKKTVYTFDPTANPETGMIGVDLELTAPDDPLRFSSRVIVGAKDRPNTPKGLGGDSVYIIKHQGPPDEYTGIRPTIIQVISTDYLSINGTVKTKLLWQTIVDTNSQICALISQQLGVDLPWKSGPDCVGAALDRVFATYHSDGPSRYIDKLNESQTDNILLESLTDPYRIFMEMYVERSKFQQTTLKQLIRTVALTYPKDTFNWNWYCNGPSNIQTYTLGIKNRKPVLQSHQYSSFADMTSGELSPDIIKQPGTWADFSLDKTRINLFNSNEQVDQVIFGKEEGQSRLSEHVQHTALMKKPGRQYGVWDVYAQIDQTTLGQQILETRMPNWDYLEFATGDGITADEYDPHREIQLTSIELNRKMFNILSIPDPHACYDLLRNRPSKIFDDYCAVINQYGFSKEMQRKNFQAMWEGMSPAPTE